MFYVIDYDTRKPESKSKDEEELATYILDNGFESAVALVSAADDLTLNFNLKELQGLADNLGSLDSYTDEDEAAEAVMELLETADIPVFSARLAKKLLKEHRKNYKDTPEALGGPTGGGAVTQDEAEVKPKKRRQKTTSKPASRASDDSAVSVGEAPKEGTKLFEIWKLVDDNLGEATMSELISLAAEQLRMEERLARRYIVKSIRLGHLEKA